MNCKSSPFFTDFSVIFTAKICKNIVKSDIILICLLYGENDKDKSLLMLYFSSFCKIKDDVIKNRK